MPDAPSEGLPRPRQVSVIGSAAMLENSGGAGAGESAVRMELGARSARSLKLSLFACYRSCL